MEGRASLPRGERQMPGGSAGGVEAPARPPRLPFLGSDPALPGGGAAARGRVPGLGFGGAGAPSSVSPPEAGTCDPWGLRALVPKGSSAPEFDVRTAASGPEGEGSRSCWKS